MSLSTLLEDSAREAYMRPWHRIERGLRLNRLRIFTEDLSPQYNMSKEEKEKFFEFLQKTLDKKLLNTIKIIQNHLNKLLEIEGILLTMYDSRLRLCNQVVEDVKTHFQDIVFDSIIQRVTKLSEAPSFGVPVIYHDAESKGTINYLNLAKEILVKNGLISAPLESEIVS